MNPSGPRVANIEYTGTGPFKVTGLDINGGEVATYAQSDGPYSGSVAVDFHDEQDSRSLSIDADGPWTIRMVPVESLTPLPGGFTGSGDDVVLYTGGIGEVAFSHSGAGPFEVNYFEITTREIATAVKEAGPFRGKRRSARSCLRMDHSGRSLVRHPLSRVERRRRLRSVVD
ncbi:MAG: hypothetical protein M5U19_08045 [Microthrixaceae bacterium]|nr:hypothetical protein [Microthrixaceae bacterium]